MIYFIVALGLLLALVIVRISLGNTAKSYRVEFGYSVMPGMREVNADVVDWAYYGDETFLTVADGTGPGDRAKAAAEVAVRIVSKSFEQTGSTGNPAHFFVSSFHGANAAILRYIPDSTAGASLLCAVIKDNFLYYALAGNCRISVFRRGEIYDLSEGHTFDVLAREALNRREITKADALEVMKENRLYNFVGRDSFQDLEIFDVPITLKRGDIVLLMTDGVYEHCPDGEMIRILEGKSSCRDIAKKITDILNEKACPNQDNASVIAARINF